MRLRGAALWLAIATLPLLLSCVLPTDNPSIASGQIGIVAAGQGISDGGSFPFDTVAASNDVGQTTFTIVNNQTVALGSLFVSITGEDASLVQVSQPSSPIAAGGTGTFALGWNLDNQPPELYTATVSLSNDTTSQNPFTFDISATVAVASIKSR